MKLGLHLNDFAWPVAPERLGPLLAEIAQAAEAAGFSAIAVMDHVWQHPYAGQGPEGPVLEAYATLAYLAAHTSRARLLALATPVSYRFPGMLVKAVTTLDVLSGGRAWLGLGVGDYEPRRGDWASRTRRSAIATSSWRTRSRSACACGAASTARTSPTMASSCAWRGRSTPRKA